MIRAAAAALVLVVALGLTGCGGNKGAQRHDFNEYVQQVNAVENDATRAWTSARLAYMHLGDGNATAAQLRDLDAVPKTIRALRRRIRAVQAPAPARRLHADLLHLLDLDARLADELARFGHYLHDVAGLERSLGAQTKALRAGLTGSPARTAQESALAAYAARLDTLIAELVRLDPPPALAPWHAAQVRRVRSLRSAAVGLRSGLAANDRTAVARYLGELQQAVATAPVTVAERDAIVGYNARLGRIRSLTAKLSREQTQIAKELS